MLISMYVMQTHCVSIRWRSFSTFLHLKEITLQVSEPDDELFVIPAEFGTQRTSLEAQAAVKVHLVCPLYKTKSNQYVLPLGPATTKPAIPALKLGSPPLEDFSPVMYPFLQAAESIGNG